MMSIAGSTAMKRSDKPHSGINYHKLSVGGHWQGVFIVIACCALLFAINTPFTRYFLVFSVVSGIVIGLLLFFGRREKPVNTHTFLPLAGAEQQSSQIQTLSSKQEPTADRPDRRTLSTEWKEIILPALC